MEISLSLFNESLCKHNYRILSIFIRAKAYKNAHSINPGINAGVNNCCLEMGFSPDDICMCNYMLPTALRS